jgi:predicted acyltransferase
MWQGTWDPEGILTTFPSIVIGMCGLLAGHLLLSNRMSQEKVMGMMVLGFCSVATGYIWGQALYIISLMCENTPRK